MTLTTDLASLAFARKLIASEGRHLREQAGLSLSEVAATMPGRPRAVDVRAWEDGRVRPHQKNALAYGALLVELKELALGGAE